MQKMRILSGVQPTGNLHLGNYLGAIKNWVSLQDKQKKHDLQTKENFFCIVDLHAATVPQDPIELHKATLRTTAAYIALGVDLEQSAIFVQSAIAAHCELAWLLSCFTPMGWLNRMTQFKEKAGKHKENAGLALYSYPVLMAADILLYKATHIPVGEDQKQHLELTRDIAGAFNRHYGVDIFPLPEPVIMEQAARIMSLRDGTKKMSKSDSSDYSRINLTDDADIIAKKIKKAKTDSIAGISYDIENRPEASNLVGIYAALAGISIEKTITMYNNKGFAELKQDLADLAVAKIAPMAEKIRELEDNKDYLYSVLQKGQEQALTLASTTMNEVKHIMGFVNTKDIYPVRK